MVCEALLPEISSKRARSQGLSIALLDLWFGFHMAIVCMQLPLDVFYSHPTRLIMMALDGAWL